MWVAGCRPSARSFADWNFPALDPPTAVFAQQVLDKKNENNVVNEIEKLGTSYYFQESSSNFAAAPSSTTDKKSSMNSDKRLSRRRGALLPTDIEDIVSKKSSSVVLGRKIFQSAQQDESHPIGLEITSQFIFFSNINFYKFKSLYKDVVPNSTRAFSICSDIVHLSTTFSTNIMLGK